MTKIITAESVRPSETNYKLKKANQTKRCPPEYVHRYLTTFVTQNLLQYLNFEKGTKAEALVKNTRKYLSITIRLWW